MSRGETFIEGELGITNNNWAIWIGWGNKNETIKIKKKVMVDVPHIIEIHRGRCP